MFTVSVMHVIVIVKKKTFGQKVVFVKIHVIRSVDESF